jgi:UDP-N-acetylglucosamine transferase subunit ALG13
MIFVTVGTQGQFDRLIRAVDEWAGAHERADVFAQTGPSSYRPEHIRSEQFVDATAFRKHVEAASLVISHAGMGSIITALELGKRIIVVPRRASLGEHRNDHQLATAKRFAEQGSIMVAFTEQELVEKLDRLQAVDETVRLGAQASPRLISTIRTFIETGRIS